MLQNSVKKNGENYSQWEQDTMLEAGMSVEQYNKSEQHRVDWQEFFDDPHSSMMANLFATLVMPSTAASSLDVGDVSTSPVHTQTLGTPYTIVQRAMSSMHEAGAEQRRCGGRCWCAS